MSRASIRDFFFGRLKKVMHQEVTFDVDKNVFGAKRISVGIERGMTVGDFKQVLRKNFNLQDYDIQIVATRNLKDHELAHEVLAQDWKKAKISLIRRVNHEAPVKTKSFYLQRSPKQVDGYRSRSPRRTFDTNGRSRSLRRSPRYVDGLMTDQSYQSPRSYQVDGFTSGGRSSYRSPVRSYQQDGFTGNGGRSYRSPVRSYQQDGLTSDRRSYRSPVRSYQQDGVYSSRTDGWGSVPKTTSYNTAENVGWTSGSYGRWGQPTYNQIGQPTMSTF